MVFSSQFKHIRSRYQRDGIVRWSPATTTPASVVGARSGDAVGGQNTGSAPVTR
jgi:hypothetical protein